MNLILLTDHSDSRFTQALVLRSLLRQGFTGLSELHNNSFKPTPLRGAA